MFAKRRSVTIDSLPKLEPDLFSMTRHGARHCFTPTARFPKSVCGVRGKDGA